MFVTCSLYCRGLDLRAAGDVKFAGGDKLSVEDLVVTDRERRVVELVGPEVQLAQGALMATFSGLIVRYF